MPDNCSRIRAIPVEGLAALFFFLFLISPASAIPTVMNAKLLTDAAPGDVITFPITVNSDTGDSPTTMYVDVLGFGQAPDMAYAPLAESLDTSPYSARPYITLDKTSVNVGGGGSETVTATISIPKDAKGGGRYAIIVLHSGTGAASSVESYAVAYQITVMITITGTPVAEKGTITEVSATQYSTGGPTIILTTLENTGNHHYYNTVNSVKVSDQSGNLVKSVTLSPTLFAIIPTSEVQYMANLGKPLAAGSYTVDSTVTLEGGTVLDAKSTKVTIGTSGITPAPTDGSSGTAATRITRIYSFDWGESARINPNAEGASVPQSESRTRDYGINILSVGSSGGQNAAAGSYSSADTGGSQVIPEQTWAKTSATISPGNQGRLQSSNQQISVTIPEGAVIGDAAMTLEPVPRAQLAGPPANYRIGGTTFRVEGLNGLLAKEATITIRYSQADRDAAGGDPSKLVLARWDESTGQWTLFPTTVDLNEGTLTVATNHMSTWAVMVQSGGPVAAKTTYTPAPGTETICGILALLTGIAGYCKRR